MATLAEEPSLPFAAPAEGAAGWPRRALGTLKARWWVVLAVLAAALLAAIIYLRTATYFYTATLRVSPAQSSTRDAPRGGTLSNLASLAGIPGTAAAASPFQLYLEGVYTREVADRLARNDRLMHTVFANEWDIRTRTWQPPSSLARSLRLGLFEFLGVPQPAWKRPDGARLRDFIAATVAVQQSVKTPLVSISFDATDGPFAVRFLNELHGVTDDYLREKAAARTRGNVLYLEQKLREVTLAEQRQALFDALSDEERELMLANSSAPYAADPFGLTTVSPGPTRPRALVLLLAAVVLGTGGGVVLALLLGPTSAQRRRADGAA